MQTQDIYVDTDDLEYRNVTYDTHFSLDSDIIAQEATMCHDDVALIISV